VVRDEALYLASAADILAVVRHAGPRVAHLLLIGHNPGMSELANLLVREAERASLATAALCSIAYECADWSEVGEMPAREVMRESPPGGFFGLFS
jgi:phosphohistidine phosphatase